MASGPDVMDRDNVARSARDTCPAEPIRIHTLGRFVVLVGGRPIDFRHKVQRRPLDLLKVLIALGGRDVAEELLSDVLWSDNDGDLAHRCVATTLYRLRRLLGHKEAIQVRAGLVTLSSRYCWVDVWALERQLGLIEETARTQRPDLDTLLRLSTQAAQLYQGSFLEKEGEKPWAVPLRERLRTRFLHMLYELGRRLTIRRRWEEAIPVYEKGLQAHDLAEEFYRQLIICNTVLGRRVEALRLYERCREALADGLGLKPAADTTSLYLALRQGDVTNVARILRQISGMQMTPTPA